MDHRTVQRAADRTLDHVHHDERHDSHHAQVGQEGSGWRNRLRYAGGASSVSCPSYGHQRSQHRVEVGCHSAPHNTSRAGDALAPPSRTSSPRQPNGQFGIAAQGPWRTAPTRSIDCSVCKLNSSRSTVASASSWPSRSKVTAIAGSSSVLSTRIASQALACPT